MYRSGTEEEYSELVQLLQDIHTYQRDAQIALVKEKEKEKETKRSEKVVAEEMRKSEMETLAGKCIWMVNLCNTQLSRSINRSCMQKGNEEKRQLRMMIAIITVMKV